MTFNEFKRALSEKGYTRMDLIGRLYCEYNSRFVLDEVHKRLFFNHGQATLDEFSINTATIHPNHITMEYGNYLIYFYK